METKKFKKSHKYVHKTTPIPKRVRQFCHPSSSNSNLHDDTKNNTYNSNIVIDTKKSSTPNVVSSISTVHSLNSKKHSLCSFQPHEFNFPNISTPFSTHVKLGYNEEKKEKQTKDTSHFLNDYCSPSHEKHNLSQNNSLGTPKKNFSHLLHSPSKNYFNSSTKQYQYSAELTNPTVKSSPFKTDSKVDCQKTSKDSRMSSSSIENGPTSWQQRSYLAVKRHVYRNSVNKLNSLDKNVGNLVQCRFEPDKVTVPMMQKATNFFNLLNNQQTHESIKQLSNQNPTVDNADETIHNPEINQISYNNYTTRSKVKSKRVSFSDNNDKSNILQPKFSIDDSTKFNDCVLVKKQVIDNDDFKHTDHITSPVKSSLSVPVNYHVNEFFDHIQREANQLNNPRIREELTSKLLNDESLALSYSSTLPYHASNNDVSSCPNSTKISNITSNNLLFDVIKNSLLSFEVALKFIIGFSSNFYNCYKDITSAGEDSILAIEDSMINNIKLMETIPDNLVKKFLNFGKYCSDSIKECEINNTLTVASLRNISNYFNDELAENVKSSVDQCVNLTNCNTLSSQKVSEQAYFSSNISSKSPIVEKCLTNTSTPNHLTNSKIDGNINKENLYPNYYKTCSSIMKSKMPKKRLNQQKNSKGSTSRFLMDDHSKFTNIKTIQNISNKSPSLSYKKSLNKCKPPTACNLILNLHTNNKSNNGYYSKSSRRLSFRRSSLFLQSASQMSESVMQTEPLKKVDDESKQLVQPGGANSSVTTTKNLDIDTQNQKSTASDSPSKKTISQSKSGRKIVNSSLHASSLNQKKDNSPTTTTKKATLTSNEANKDLPNRRSARIKSTATKYDASKKSHITLKASKKSSKKIIKKVDKDSSGKIKSKKPLTSKKNLSTDKPKKSVKVSENVKTVTKKGTNKPSKANITVKVSKKSKIVKDSLHPAKTSSGKGATKQAAAAIKQKSSKIVSKKVAKTATRPLKHKKAKKSAQ